MFSWSPIKLVYQVVERYLSSAVGGTCIINPDRRHGHAMAIKKRWDATSTLRLGAPSETRRICRVCTVSYARSNSA